MIKLKDLLIELDITTKKPSTYWYKGMNPTVDNVILKKTTDSYDVLLIRRKGEVEHGKLALPGGFIDTTSKKGEEWKPGRETPKQAAIRELEEETGLDINSLTNMIEEVGVYEGNNRDPRDTEDSWSRSYAFVLLLPDDFPTDKIVAKDDASDAGWFDVKTLPKLAFDHSKILSDALEKVKS